MSSRNMLRYRIRLVNLPLRLCKIIIGYSGFPVDAFVNQSDTKSSPWCLLWSTCGLLNTYTYQNTNEIKSLMIYIFCIYNRSPLHFKTTNSKYVLIHGYHLYNRTGLIHCVAVRALHVPNLKTQSESWISDMPRNMSLDWPLWNACLVCMMMICNTNIPTEMIHVPINFEIQSEQMTLSDLSWCLLRRFSPDADRMLTTTKMFIMVKRGIPSRYRRT